MLHYQAYRRMCASNGVDFDWGERAYCRIAMRSSIAFKEALLAAYPKLASLSWNALYEEKKKHLIDILHEGKVELMPGVYELLEALEKKGIKRCVVTHSLTEHINIIRKYQPILDTIPVWITREYYSKPKPDPECYQKAISEHLLPGEKAVGFEDSPRGLQALLGTSATGVLVTDLFTTDEVEAKRPFHHTASLKDISL